MAPLLALGGGHPGTGKLGHPSADPKPQMCHLLGDGDCLACGGLLGTGQGHGAECQGVPASAQELVAAKRQRCTIKVFVKQLSWALWASLRALFRLAVSEKEKKKKKTALGGKPELAWRV